MLSLDHAIIFAHDLGRAADQYRRLGFTLTPRGQHPTLGTANHTIMLERDYLELLTVERPGAGNARWAASLAMGDGFGAVALGTKDARATREQLSRRGFEIPDVIDFSRPVMTAGGQLQARFSVAHLPDEATPALPAFFCQQHTPELVWLPEYQRHDNTAFLVAGLVVAHPDPASVSSGYQRLLGGAAVHPHPGGIQADLRGTRLAIVARSFVEQRLGVALGREGIVPVGVTIGVRQLDRCRAVLVDRGVAFRDFGRRSILVDRDAACGVALEFLGI